VVNVLALVRYRRVHEALRRGESVPFDRLPAVFGWLVAGLSALVVVYTIAGAL
jgi:hypothetical protein